MWSLLIGAVLCGLAPLVAALDAVEVAGNKLFNKDGSQFLIKGEISSLQPLVMMVL